MRPFLLAGSALLALSTPVAVASATTVTFINSSPGLDGEVPTSFVQGDVLVNPGGLFNGRLQTDGNFIVSYGTNPNTSRLWDAGFSNTSNGPYGLGNYRGNTKLFGTSLTSYYVYKNNNPVTSFYELAGSNYYNAPTFLSLNDNGSLSIYPGKNGVATGAPITTVGSPTTTVARTNVSSITYDLDHQSDSLPTRIASTKQICDNRQSNIPFTCTLSLSVGYTETNTYTWSESQATALSIESTTTLKMPGVTEAVTFGLTSTTTITNGKSNEESVARTYTATSAIPVPPFSEYSVQTIGEELTGSIPFVWTGTAEYKNGASGLIDGTGIYEGTGANDFITAATCVYNPDGCGPPVQIAPVPEPSSALLLPVAILAMVIASSLLSEIPNRSTKCDGATRQRDHSNNTAL